MNIEEGLKYILAEMLDIDVDDIGLETYLIRELGAESIDLLELVLDIGSRFGIKVDENRLFLKKIGIYISEAKQQRKDIIPYLESKFPFLTKNRLTEICQDIDGIAPPLKIKDLVSYIEWVLNAVPQSTKER